MINKKKTFGMVDTSEKAVTKRTARAQASVKFTKKSFELFLKKGSPKGDVLESARVAGVMAAKKTSGLIPFCHPLELNKVSVEYKLTPSRRSIQIMSEVVCSGKTGVEMEALAAVSVAALTIYDMMKWADHSIQICNIRLLFKSGGKSGTFSKI